MTQLPLEQPERLSERTPAPMNPSIGAASALYWMPVPVPGLTYSEQTQLMQHVDRGTYVTPSWLRAAMLTNSTPHLAPDPGRDPRNPAHWAPLPPPNVVC